MDHGKLRRSLWLAGWLPKNDAAYFYRRITSISDIQLGMRSSGRYYCKWLVRLLDASPQLAYWTRLARWTIAKLNGTRSHQESQLCNKLSHEGPCSDHKIDIGQQVSQISLMLVFIQYHPSHKSVRSHLITLDSVSLPNRSNKPHTGLTDSNIDHNGDRLHSG